MNQIPLFAVPPVGQSLQRARRERDKGIKRVSANNAEFLKLAREAAKTICQRKGWVCSDDIRAWSDANGIRPSHFNAFGAVLTTKEFTPGEYIVSKQVQGHANRVRRWVLRGNV